MRQTATSSEYNNQRWIFADYRIRIIFFLEARHVAWPVCNHVHLDRILYRTVLMATQLLCRCSLMICLRSLEAAGELMTESGR